MSKTRNWFFTLNNPDVEADRKHLLNLKCKYVKFQYEKGEKTGILHFQGVVIMDNACRLTSMKKVHPRANWKPMRSLKGSLIYVGKEKTRLDGPWDAGTCPKVQGQRTDLEAVAESVRDGATLTDVAESHPHMIVKYSRGLQALRSLTAPKREWPTELYVYTGATGTGKTRQAFELSKNPYFKPVGEWWDGYDGHEDVIIDDFACDMPITQLLRLADRYPMQVPVKGGFVQFVAKRIFITSNLNLGTWYGSARKAHVDALHRRITEHKCFYSENIDEV